MTSVKKSFFWSTIEQLIPQTIRFILFVVLARLLEPSDFGLVAMLALFMAIAGVFIDSGFSAALIQRKDITADDETSIFAFNIIAALAFAILLCLISPLIAAFYQQKILISLLCVNSLTLVIASFGMVHSKLLLRNMLFKKTALISTVSTAIAGMTGITMAFLGFGVWSLLGVGISENLVRTALYYKMSSWRPRGMVRFKNIQSMWGFSSRLLVCNLIGVTYQNTYAVIIGKVYSPESLGYFNRANRLRMLPVNVLSGIVASVAFPLFSKHQDDSQYLLAKMREIVRTTMLISAASMILLAVIADPLIPLLLTEKWRPAIPLLRILCFASVTFPIHALYLMALQAQGLSHLNLRLESIKLVVGMGSIAVVYRYGVTALALNVVGMTVFAYFLNAWYNVKILKYHWWLQAFDILPAFILCCVSGYAAWWIGANFLDDLLAILAVQVITFLTLCFTGVFVFRKIYFDEVWGHFVWACDRIRL
ncbi:MAG: lipopolysaccharide biosynthesis protein [Xanthomonadales bacterium]|nr:lipopolysaccharide biosynthesis protein [Xanthomonadales bacterium]